jgi:hypothetical protein
VKDIIPVIVIIPVALIAIWACWKQWTQEDHCDASPTGRHEWGLSNLERGVGLSRSQTCKHCGEQQVNL